MFGALRSFASTLMQPVGQTFGPAPEPPAPELAAEYQIQQRRVVLDADYRLDYVWWELRDRNAPRNAPSLFRVMRMDELVEVPIESRDDPDLMGKSWAALRGLYRAGHDTLYMAVGVREPDITVAQLYGSAFDADNLEEAVEGAEEAQNAVRAELSNFLHSRVKAPSEALWGHVQRQMRDLPHLVALHGYPDPRSARKGLTRDGSFGADDDELASQQGEMFLRGMAALNKEFLFAMLAHALDQDTLIAGQTRLDRVAGEFASRQKGSINASFGAALPLAGSLGQTDSASMALGETESVGGTTSSSESQTFGDSDSSGTSTGLTETQSQGQGQTVGSGWTQTEGQSLGQTQTQSLGRGQTLSSGQTASQGTTESVGQTTGLGESATQSEGLSRTSGQGQSVSTGEGQTQGSTWSAGQTESQGVSQAQGATRGGSQGVTLGETQSQGQTQGQSQGVGSGWTRGQTQSQTLSQGSGETVGQSLGTGYGLTQSQGSGWTESTSTGDTESSQISGGTSDSNDFKVLGVGTGHSTTNSASHGLGESSSQSSSTSGSTGTGQSQSVQSGQSQGQSQTQGQSVGQGQSQGQSGSQTQSQSQGVSQSQGQSRSQSQSESWGQSQTQGQTQARGVSQAQGGSTGQSRTQAQASSLTDSAGQSQTDSAGQSRTQGSSQGQGWTRGAAQTQGQALSQTQSQSQGLAQTLSHTQGQSGSQGQSQTTGLARGVSQSQSTGLATSRGQGWTTGEAQSTGLALAQTRGQMSGMARGVSGGLVPTMSVGRSWQTEDDSAIRLTGLTRDLANIGFSAVKDGGWLTTVLILVEQGAASAAVALASQAFHGQNVPRPVQASLVAEDTILRDGLMAMRGDTRQILDKDLIPFDGCEMLWNEYATMLPPSLLAAYYTPNLFEQGATLTMQEKLPPFAFYPRPDGEVVLGHQVSPETAQLTRVPLRLERQRHFHTAFCGDTGFGKSVAAERMAYETTLHWGLRTIVLDFGAGWRKMLNAPGLEGKVEIRQLWPQGPRPLRWNPLQIGRHIAPELHWRTFCDIFGQIAQLGEKRQIHELRNVLGRVYSAAGVFVDEQAVRLDPVWGEVRNAAEAAVTGFAAGTRLADLTPAARQLLAVARSRAVGFVELVTTIQRERENISPRDIRGNMLDGIVERLSTFVEGGARGQFAGGSDAVEICELIPESGGIAVLEGGMFLDDFTKAFLLAWASWLIYTDTVIGRVGRARSEPAQLQIIFEEANKILGGSVARQGEEGGQSVAERFEAMWRDSRKYGIWLHLLTQTPSAIPPGIMSSCNNLFVGQLKNAKDRDLVTSSMHRSEKGLVDEQFRNFISRQPVARMIVKLGYSMESSEVEPVYIQPALLDVEEPSDEQIAERLGRVELRV